MSLTIEFAGVTTFLWRKANAKDKDAQHQGEVVLVDLGNAGFHPHHATLATEGNRGITCPDPDTSVAVPGWPSELGIWNLKNAEIELIADAAPLTVEDGEINAQEPPPDTTGSIRWLPEIGSLCQSRTLAPRVPSAARMRLNMGRVSATAAKHPPVRVVFDEVVDGEDRVIDAERYILPRFMVEIECARAILRLDGQREFRFDADHHVIISNTCVCDHAKFGAANHFYGHYALLEAKRKPRVRQTSGEFRRPKHFSVPSDPAQCYCAYAMI
jgi:hypothetical protein